MVSFSDGSQMNSDNRQGKKILEPSIPLLFFQWPVLPDQFNATPRNSRPASACGSISYVPFLHRRQRQWQLHDVQKSSGKFGAVQQHMEVSDRTLCAEKRWREKCTTQFDRTMTELCARRWMTRKLTKWAKVLWTKFDNISVSLISLFSLYSLNVNNVRGQSHKVLYLITIKIVWSTFEDAQWPDMQPWRYVARLNTGNTRLWKDSSR